ncbi:MAG: hypothetical protein JWO10_95, partial [Microbacteriaceae bacterium]|nr:hypothetical protein [Microbacteriaceae bacterium]
PELLRSVFHDAATIDKGAGPMGRDDYVDDVMRRHSLVRVASHQITNVLVQFVSETRAFVESWGIAVERRDEADGVISDWIFRVRYGDTADLRDGTWRITDRMLVTDLIMAVPVAAGLDDPDPTRFAGQRSAEDSIEKRRASLGL